MRYLAVDIGASSGKIVAGSLDSGVLRSEVVHRFPNELKMKGDYLIWDIDALFSCIIEGLSLAGRADFISIDTWGVDFVLLDKDGDVIGDPVSYRDGRTSRLSYYPDQNWLYARTGIQMQRFNTVYQLLYLKEKHPDYLEKAESLLFIPDYLNFLLTGIKAQEYTFASTSNLLSSETGCWDYELIRSLGLPERLFVSLRKPGELLGRIKPEIDEKLGYSANVLLAPSHDTASAVVGAPLDEDSLFLSSGTWSLLGAVINHPITTDEACRANFTNEGAADGHSIRFLRNIMGTWMLQCLKKESGCSFDELEALAENTVPCGVVDPGESRFLAPLSMKNAIDEALAEKGFGKCSCDGEYAAVVYHSLAAAYRDAAAFISQITGRTFSHIAIVGGGSRDEYLCQLTADYTGLRVTAGPAEGTAIGNILFQMISSGEVSLSEKNDILRRSAALVTYQRRNILSMYDEAMKKYRSFGIDTEEAIRHLADAAVSVHCWQGDDVTGFDRGEALSGGIQATGSYPGKARTPEELRSDIDKAFSLIPGKKKLNLHASYAVFSDGCHAERDELKPEHFKFWVDYAKEKGIGLDFNPTLFSHPMVVDNLTLSSPVKEVRDFWIRHCICCIRISEYFARETGFPCVMNIWIPDGFKDIPADRLGPRSRFKESLDEILSIPYDKSLVFVTLESKVFGIGLESYTVGSAEFCLSYSDYKGITPLMDNGHYHPTEVVSDKISSMLLFHDHLALHITRPVRWDSDHVVLFDDETREIAKEIVRNEALDRVFIATDYFDASINRISAWVTGVRNVQKALLFALLQPYEKLRELQDASDYTTLMALQEELKTLPFGAVWEEFLSRSGLDSGLSYLDTIREYEDRITSRRK